MPAGTIKLWLAILREAHEALGEVALIGLERSDEQMERRWNALAKWAASTGLTRLAARPEALAAAVQAVEFAVAVALGSVLSSGSGQSAWA